ncbi:hypothetical protein V1477_015835, partial [Vespula maculifrons]
RGRKTERKGPSFNYRASPRGGHVGQSDVATSNVHTKRPGRSRSARTRLTAIDYCICIICDCVPRNFGKIQPCGRKHPTRVWCFPRIYTYIYVGISVVLVVLVVLIFVVFIVFVVFVVFVVSSAQRKG